MIWTHVHINQEVALKCRDCPFGLGPWALHKFPACNGTHLAIGRAVGPVPIVCLPSRWICYRLYWRSHTQFDAAHMSINTQKSKQFVILLTWPTFSNWQSWILSSGPLLRIRSPRPGCIQLEWHGPTGVHFVWSLNRLGVHFSAPAINVPFRTQWNSCKTTLNSYSFYCTWTYFAFTADTIHMPSCSFAASCPVGKYPPPAFNPSVSGIAPNRASFFF